jgi:hypothetical protein
MIITKRKKKLKWNLKVSSSIRQKQASKKSYNTHKQAFLAKIMEIRRNLIDLVVFATIFYAIFMFY